jgi:hypothetical protein
MIIPMAILNSLAGILLEMGMAIIVAVLSLIEHLAQTDNSVSQNFGNSLCIVVIFDTSMSGYSLW